MNTQNPLLSIICPTYNQEKYIVQALEGFLIQETSFHFEIIVHDDASTDSTAAIVKEYEARFPGRFANIYQTENQLSKAMDNVTRITFAAARGKYIALCEGDDYWTDPLKLQKQVGFLEENNDYSICFHEVKVIHEDGTEIFYNKIAENTRFNIIDLLHNNFFATVSCVFRVFDYHKNLPAWFTGSAANDYGLKILNAAEGRLYYIKDCMAIYRVHRGGIWSSQSNTEMYEHGIKIIDSLDAAFKFKYNQEFEVGKKLRHQRFFPQNNTEEKKITNSSLVSRLKRKINKYLIK